VNEQQFEFWVIAWVFGAMFISVVVAGVWCLVKGGK
jgi:hypothetical protein